MFGTAAGFGEVGVGVFEDWVLVAMTELVGKSGVAIVMVFFGFGCTFGAVGIVIGNFGHENLLSSGARAQFFF